ncbi:MAG TPA: glycosyltransferase family 4 protein [Stellaceae bacterium]|nr:glycosyltransferase family 4 protein [Stellaceae bacterium]
MRQLAFLIPGSIRQLTGGYLYARRLVEGLGARGIGVSVMELAGQFPAADAEARAACEAALEALEDGAVTVIDGLALAGCADGLERAARRLRLIALIHHPLAAETGIGAEEAARFAALEARLLPLPAGVICPSACTAAAVAAYGVAASRIAIAPPGTMKPAQPPVRATDGACRLLTVATVTPRKGHDVLISALARLGERRWRLRLVGSLTRDPATAIALRTTIAALRFGERVSLEGEWPHERLAAAYASSDVFVLASHHEGYGMAFAEALAFGLPVAATTAGAIPGTVPACAGLLVPPGDAMALAAALARLIDDAPLRVRLAAGAAAAGAALPDWNQAVQGWLDAARRLIG